jgi:hypothetical protein
MLLFFVLLNIFLVFFLYQERRRYTLSPEQDQAIFSVFTQNRISGYSRLIRQYPPMRPLAVSGFDYDMDALLAMFFPFASDSPEHESSPNRDVYTHGDARLVISNGYISYDNIHGLGERLDILNRETALLTGDAFIARHYPHYVQDYVLAVPEGFRIFYRERYRDYIIHSNFIELLVTENGITQVDMQYGIVLEFSGLPREICSPDEALLTFIQRIRSIRPDMPVLITHMDLVYYKEEIRSRAHDTSVGLNASPYYRIFIEDNEVPFKINAYTNVCIN